MAYAADYSSLTDIELNSELNAIRNELTIRDLISKNKQIIFENELCQICINDEFFLKNSYGLQLVFQL
jgi:hypothetical protein